MDGFTSIATVIDFSFDRAWSNLLLMAIAYGLALPIAWNREEEDRSAGLRTFPLVAMASCGFMLIALYSFQDEHALSRVLQGIIGGIGFIGGGAILKSKGSVRGTATAASLWGTGALAVAVAWGHIEIAAMLSLISFLTLAYLKKFGESVKTEINGDSDADDD